MKHWFWQKRKVWMTASGIAGCIILLRISGLLQSFEWTALDQFLRLRPSEPTDERIVIVEVTEADLETLKEWPLSDTVMSRLLQKIAAHRPRAIGLDIYRNLPVEPGHTELENTFASLPNLIGIEKLKDNKSLGVAPPPALNQSQISFNNVVLDADGKVRRGILYWTVDGRVYESFALRVALLYLAAEGVVPESAYKKPQYLRLGQAVFKSFEPDDGAYVRADAGGYQILTNFRGTSHHFETVSISQVLADQVDPNLMRDRIVLIGSTAPSLQDFFYTSYSGSVVEAAKPMPGVELHANLVSQIVSAALEGRPLMRVLPKPMEWVWIWIWSWVGANLSWKFRSPQKSALWVFLGGTGLSSICYVVLLEGWWIPLVPPMLAMVASAVTITGYIAYLEEELKKSKEFLNSVINTIPDPVFVKDKAHRWVVLNEAYCKFIGHPLKALIEKSDHDFFPPEEADIFWHQDELVFEHGESYENEENFTDAQGVKYFIATKRSLHKDAAGNLFLVGVIRDITARKQMEQELKRTTAELARSNAELKLVEGRLRHMAYHDPLTGLPNREMFQDRLKQVLIQARESDQLVALLFLDLDGFKLINDSQGHNVGDLLLQAVALRLTGCLRGSDTVSRLGGDEFVIILPGISDCQDAARVAEKILETLSYGFVIEGKTISVTTSIGISIYPFDAEEMDVLIKNADAAMYRAKGVGKNCYEFSHLNARLNEVEDSKNL